MLQDIEKRIARHEGDREPFYDSLIAVIDAKIEAVSDTMAYVEPVQSSLSTFDELNKSAIDAGTKGIGRLVDADMNETAARLKALEVLQQRAVQALCFANSEPSSILDLFR